MTTWILTLTCLHQNQSLPDTYAKEEGQEGYSQVIVFENHRLQDSKVSSLPVSTDLSFRRTEPFLSSLLLNHLVNPVLKLVPYPCSPRFLIHVLFQQLQG